MHLSFTSIRDTGFTIAHSFERLTLYTSIFISHEDEAGQSPVLWTVTFMVWACSFFEMITMHLGLSATSHIRW